MKKLFLILCIYVSFSGIEAEDVHAASLVAGALEPTQILNNIQLLFVDFATTATEISTYLTRIKLTVLDPIGDGLIAMSQLQSANSIVNLITGSQGNSLIISDPKQYFEGRGLEIVKRSLGNIAGQQTVYSDSIYGTVLSSFKQTSLETQLKTIGQSQISSLLQKDICNEATLLSLAQKDVLANGGKITDSVAIQTRKVNLYNTLCIRNPTTDKVLAQVLASVQKQRPEVGGWNTWLALTGGDNAYNKSLQASTQISLAQKQAESLALTDFNNGRGVVSQTVCTEYATQDEQGNPIQTQTDANCILRQIVNPAGLLSDSLTKAANAGFDRLTTIQGDSGWGSAASLLASVKGILSGINKIKTTVNGITGTTNYNNTPTTVTIAQKPTNNLTGDPEGKAAIVTPIKNLITTNLDLVDQLDSASRQQVALITPYEARVKEMKACWDEVDPKNEQAKQAYNIRMEGINKANATIAANFQSVSTVKKISQETITALNKSESSEEISLIFQTYQAKMSSSNTPDYKTIATYKGQYIKDKSTIDADMGGSGELTTWIRQCEQERVARTFRD